MIKYDVSEPDLNRSLNSECTFVEEVVGEPSQSLLISNRNLLSDYLYCTLFFILINHYKVFFYFYVTSPFLLMVGNY